MNKFIILLILIVSLLTFNSVLANPIDDFYDWMTGLFSPPVTINKPVTIGSFQPQNKIDIISQTGTDINIQWTFTEINNTHWLASFTLPPIATVKNYPLQPLTEGITFSKSSIDQTKESSFYIIFPKGFKEGLSAKFGLNSTIIGSSTTTPFYANQRAICRDGTDRIHMAWLMNTSAIVYANSTDGITWTTKYINDTTSAKSPPHISCDGNNITIGYEATALDDINVYLSTNNGGSFSLVTPVTSGVYGTIGGVVIERRGQRIYLIWQEKNNLGSDIKFINSTDGGSTWGTIKDLWTGTYLPPFINMYYQQPSIIVNGTGTANDRIFVLGYFSDSVEIIYDLVFKYSTDSGVTFTDRWFSGISSYNSLLGHSLGYDDNPEQLFVSYGYGEDIYALNSSNLGVSWTSKVIYNETSSRIGRNPSVALDTNQESCVFFQYSNTTGNRDNIGYVNRNNTIWNTTYTNITTNFLRNQYPNTRWNYNAKGIDFIWVNGTASPYNISYDIINCTNVVVTPPVTTTTTTIATTSTTTTTTTSTTTTTTIIPVMINMTLNDTQGNYYYLNTSFANITVFSNVTALINLSSNMTGWNILSEMTPFYTYPNINCSLNDTWYNFTAFCGNSTYTGNPVIYYGICYVTTTTTTTTTTSTTTTTTSTTTTTTIATTTTTILPIATTTIPSLINIVEERSKKEAVAGWFIVVLVGSFILFF